MTQDEIDKLIVQLASTLSSPPPQLIGTGAAQRYAEDRLRELVKAVRPEEVDRDAILEEAAKACEDEWRKAPNTRESGYRQNAVSHGCIACALAIRALKQREPQGGDPK